MKAAIKRLAARPLRYAANHILRRPWLKKRTRDLIIRMPHLHSLLLRVMFQGPAVAKSRVDQENLSPNARRAHRALKQAIRTQRR